MKVSEMIEKLQQAKEKYGDLEIVNRDYPRLEVENIVLAVREEEYFRGVWYPEALVMDIQAR